MEKRLILTIALSLLVLLTWSAFVAKIQPVDNKEVASKNLPPPPPETQPSVIEAILSEKIPTQAISKSSLDKYELVIHDKQAAIQKVIFKEYQSSAFLLRQGLWLRDSDLSFTKESSSEEQITFVHRDQEKQIIKRFLFSNLNYNIELEIEVQNLSDKALNFELPLVLGELDFAADPNEARFQDVTVAVADKILHLHPRKNNVTEQVKFLGLRNQYFCAIIEPMGKNNYSAYVRKINNQLSEVGLQPLGIEIMPQQKIEEKFRIYLGPQELGIINRLKPEWSAVMYYGTFDFISRLLLQLLNFIFKLLHNWGWSIIILSLFIYFLLYPLTLKQLRSMKEMQALQPQIEELRRAHKNNPQKLNKEIMELYRAHKVNPFGGCLPLVLQIPIFFALYQALIRSIVLKGAKFLWIKDLSQPDRLFILPLSPRAIPIIGNEINILPILMAIQMFIQQKLSLKLSAASSSAEQQKLMSIIFPFFFGMIFYRMPSGLVLYWFINSSLMLFYQLRTSRQR